MTESLIKSLVESGPIGILAVVLIVIVLWFAKWSFANFQMINRYLMEIRRDLGRLLERNKIDSKPPPIRGRRDTIAEESAPHPVEDRPPKKIGVLRHATPLPFWPVAPGDNEEG